MAEKYTEAQKRASLKYQQSKTQIKITVDNNQAERLKQIAEYKNMSLTQLILREVGGIKMYKLIDGRDKSFEVVGEENILHYLDYPSDMSMDEASDRLEEENDGMDFYHIVEM